MKAEVERVVRVREAVTLTGLSRVTLWRMARDGTFPSPVRLGQRATGYRLSEILAWIESRPVVLAQEGTDWWVEHELRKDGTP